MRYHYFYDSLLHSGSIGLFHPDLKKNRAETWDDQIDKELFRTSGLPDYSAVVGKLDEKNSIVFAGYQDPDVITVTSVWYYRSTGQIVESDMLLTSTGRGVQPNLPEAKWTSEILPPMNLVMLLALLIYIPIPVRSYHVWVFQPR